MRRVDREISNKTDITDVLKTHKVLRLGMVSERGAYIVPVNYGFYFNEDNFYLYFHSAKEGRKIDILKGNNQICFEIDGKHELIASNVACKYSYAYESVIGYGKVEFLEEYDVQLKAMNIIMEHQTGSRFTFPKNAFSSVEICRIDVTDFSCKRHEK